MKLKREDRIWRAGKMGLACLRNIAYHRAGSGVVQRGMGGSFWLDAHGNFYFIAVLHWCKLFGDPKSGLYWDKVIEEPDVFYRRMLKHVKISQTEFEDYKTEIRKFRDKYVAHLDDELPPKFPKLEVMRKTASFLYDYLKQKDGRWILPPSAPETSAKHSREMLSEAQATYARL